MCWRTSLGCRSCRSTCGSNMRMAMARSFEPSPTCQPLRGPVVSGGPFMLTKFVQNQIVLFKRNPDWYGPKPSIDGFGYEYFADSDAEIEALKSRPDRCGAWQPITSGTAISSLKSAGFNIVNVPATIFHDIIINTMPTMVAHRELTQPEGARGDRVRDRPQHHQQGRLPGLRPARQVGGATCVRLVVRTRVSKDCLTTWPRPTSC